MLCCMAVLVGRRLTSAPGHKELHSFTHEGVRPRPNDISSLQAHVCAHTHAHGHHASSGLCLPCGPRVWPRGSAAHCKHGARAGVPPVRGRTSPSAPVSAN